MKKFKYISKYDYIDFYTKQPSFLFHNNIEILSSIDARIKKINANDSYLEEDENEEIDEFDVLDYYKEATLQNATIDENNAKIIEGKILDQQSKLAILKQFNYIKKIVDFDKETEKKYDFPWLANQTLELLKNHREIIIFQPTFIKDDLITRCDALVKINDEIKIIETKGTSTVKIIHFLDLLFQSKVLEQSVLLIYHFSFFLCVVDFIKANKRECPFVITPNFNYSKAISRPKGMNDEQWRFAKLGFNPTLIDKKHKKYEFFPINITKLIKGDFSDLLAKKEAATTIQTIKTIEAKEVLLAKLLDNFEKDLETIREIKINNFKDIDNGFISIIKPSYNDNGDFKKPDYWLSLRKLYQYEKYPLFNYSGNVVHQTGPYLSDYTYNSDIQAYFKKGYYDLFFSDLKDILINNIKCHTLLSTLKPKKVYFDFETINTATRVIDYTYPFRQIITQCSIIIDNNDNTPVSALKCNNIVIDPLNITINHFKKVVDDLFMGEHYSYIVYNKNFEASRLKELIEYINEPEYTKKILVIVNNLFDLADFFIVNPKDYAIFIKEFGGFYSIKKVLPYISKYHPDLYEKTGCKDYKKLNVGNGLDCQNKTTMRYFNMLKEEEWKQLYEDIAIYCENDVRAMIAVELLIKRLYYV